MHVSIRLYMYAHEYHSLTVLCLRYRMGHVPRSLNLPHTEAFSSDGSLNPSSAATALNQQKGKLVIVVAGKGDPGATVSTTACTCTCTCMYMHMYMYIHMCIHIHVHVLCGSL